MFNDLFSLKGRIALVTGGTRGIGKMMAQGSLEQGAKVYISGRNPERAEAAAKELSALRPLYCTRGRCRGRRRIAQACGSICAKESSVSTSSYTMQARRGARRSRSLPETGWDKVMDLNVKTPFFLTQALHGALKARRDGGPAVKGGDRSPRSMASSSTARRPTPIHASKAGVLHLAKKMAMQLIDDHIVVSAIAPGAFPTDMNKIARDTPEFYRRPHSGEARRPEDIAGAAVFLAQPGRQLRRRHHGHRRWRHRLCQCGDQGRLAGPAEAAFCAG